MKTKICKICNKEFKSYESQNRQVCSKECRLKLQSLLTKGRTKVERINKICKFCKKEFIVPRYMKNRIYCSLKCKNEGQDSSHLLKYAMKKGQIPHNKGIQWSEETHLKNRKGIYLKCAYCNKEIYLSQYRIDKAKKHYCSRKCQSLGWIKPNKKKVSYPSIFTKELKEKIKQRDEFQCVLCGMLRENHYKKYYCDLHVHHIDHNIYNCIENNLITVCSKHNGRANKKEAKKRWQYVFNSIIDLYNGNVDERPEEKEILKECYNI